MQHSELSFTIKVLRHRLECDLLPIDDLLRVEGQHEQLLRQGTLRLQYRPVRQFQLRAVPDRLRTLLI